MPIFWGCGRSFSLPAFKRSHVYNVFTSSNRYFGSIILLVAAGLMKLGTIMMEKISEIDVLNSLTLCEGVESLSILNLFNCGWEYCKKQGKIYGDTLITRFRDDISEKFEREEREKGAEMTGDTIELELKRRYPDD